MKNNIFRKVIFKIGDFIFPKHIGKESYLYMQQKIQSDTPLMVARFGAVEIKAVLYVILPPPLSYLLRKYTYKCMRNNAGFFPVDEGSLKQFAKLMLQDMKEVDILASWRPEEFFFRKRLHNAFKISLSDLWPSCDSDYWSKALQGKKILVVHPFADSIRTQYMQYRDKLFPNDLILPEFESLETIKAVQTIAGNTDGFSSWFEALEYMKNEIKEKDFEIALLGCGAYGFPLAAYIKRMGKKAIHIGGTLQLNFGIKGKRWKHYPFYNEYWVEPSANEKPKNLEKVEGGCYW
ncbi:hypothetical protein AB9N12_17630 [Bacteroides sp. AN502(2024)]|uniref:hypothetical protein n=1 Tax=Bacteroides sp. AN502(2024) TaxID=3160599 RepID=UPI003515870C